MDEQVREQNKGNVLNTIFFAIKRNIVLMLAIIIACTAVGLTYSLLQKPNYTASEKVVYRAKNVAEDGIGDNTTNNVNAMAAFVDTIVDFCDEGVVIDRANEYYKNYRNIQASDSDYTVDKHIESLKAMDNYAGQYNGDVYYITAENVSIAYTAKTNDMRFSFSVKYTDKDASVAVDKVKILVYALDAESKAVGSNGENKYFDGIQNEILDFDTESVSTSMSKKFIVLVAFVLGVVIACVVVYVKMILDRTVSTKDDLQELTGADVLAQVTYKEV